MVHERRTCAMQGLRHGCSFNLGNAVFGGLEACGAKALRCSFRAEVTMRQAARVSRPRIWPVLVPLAALAGLAILWVSLWFYAAGKAQTTIAGWREREARVGRTYACATETIGGFPFRIDARCTDP